MFEQVTLNPPDSIFGLTELFKADRREDKVNLSVGVYQDEEGKTPTLNCVQQAEAILLQNGSSKSYLPIDGLKDYCLRIANLILGEELIGRTDLHVATAQTPGGTAALRVAAEILKDEIKAPAIWVSDPTWANHLQIFNRVGLKIETYSYLDATQTRLDFGNVLGSLQQAEPGSGVLLHAVCHNPSGVDFDEFQWAQLFDLFRERKLLPVFDFAYQGFGDSPDSDAAPIRRFCGSGGEALICNSFSKNFGLYGERVGGITAVANSEDSSKAILSQIKAHIRTMYSNPPLHGAQIVNTILGSDDLRSQWLTELAEIRNRIIGLRQQFVEKIDKLTPQHDFSYIIEQRGMFSYSGLTRDQVDRLRENHGIYALGTGRINIAGLNENNMDRICQAIALVM